MELNLSNEYGRRVNENVRILALVAAVLFGIFLAFSSGNTDHTTRSDEAGENVEYMVD